ncbi:MAG TPA: DNA polymerase III subunit beta, partial [Gammaproteobacteria bacterium]|nr:DNA polymerase III subunit beta [Gammaproteobacteria bacterium]
MKITIQREALLKPLQLVTSVVEQRQALPILSHVLLQVDGDKLTLTGTDTEIELIGSARLAEPVERAYKMTLPGRKFLDICRNLPGDAMLELSEDRDRVLIKSGRSKFTLAVLSADEFPAVKDGEQTA